MAQKVHPSGFRLNTTQEHYSSWCQKNWVEYSCYLKRDYKIRVLIKKTFKDLNLSKISIRQNYSIKNININIFSNKSILLIKNFELPNFHTKIQNILNRSVSYSINIYNVTEPNADANFIAFYIQDLLKKRIPFKRIIRKATALAKHNYFVDGIKIQLSGRLNGAEIARREWIKKGQMPLQTLRSHISYVSKISKTTHGILGIKVWVFKGKELY